MHDQEDHQHGKAPQQQQDCADRKSARVCNVVNMQSRPHRLSQPGEKQVDGCQAVQGRLCKASCVRSLHVGDAWKRAHGVVYAEGSAAVSPGAVCWAMHSAVVYFYPTGSTNLMVLLEHRAALHLRSQLLGPYLPNRPCKLKAEVVPTSQKLKPYWLQSICCLGTALLSAAVQ